MRAKTITVVLMSCLLLSWIGSLKAEDLSQSINSFYRKFVDVLRDENASVKAIAALVRENRAIAERCLAAIERKYQAAEPDKKAGYGLLREKLSDGLLLTSPGKTCPQTVISALTDRLKKQYSDEDKIFFMQNILRLCPKEGAHYYPALGDLFFEQGQFGMAVAAYRKALETRDNLEVRMALAEAQRRMESYQQNKPLIDRLAELSKDRTMGLAKGLRTKLPNSIQTDKILFDEWSYSIKEESLPDLRDFAKALEVELVKKPKLSVSIEGHTDNRGPYDKNMELSKQRAEAIKQYLVEKCGVDPNRLSTRGWGPDKPFSPENDSQGWALNRRVEFKLHEQAQ